MKIKLTKHLTGSSTKRTNKFTEATRKLLAKGNLMEQEKIHTTEYEKVNKTFRKTTKENNSNITNE